MRAEFSKNCKPSLYFCSYTYYVGLDSGQNYYLISFPFTYFVRFFIRKFLFWTPSLGRPKFFCKCHQVTVPVFLFISNLLFLSLFFFFGSQVPKCLSTGIISQVFPLHDMPTLKNLRTSWVQAFFEAQPIGKRATMM